MTPDKIYLLVFIATYLLRTAAVLLIVFGLKIMISFYKYHIRMAAFANAIAESLALLRVDEMDQDNISRLERLVQVFDPHKIDFEKTPELIPEAVSDIIKAVNGAKKD